MQPDVSTALTSDPYSALPPELRIRMLSFYQHLHAHPELSMQEHATAAMIEEHLDTLSIENFRCGGTGVVGVLRNGGGPVVGFRADTDGLPIEEESSVHYRSTMRGVLPDGTDVPVMHGCGHDMHVTALMTAAEILVADRDSWSGTVVFVFQPGEETAAGARAMVDDGIWDRAPRPEIFYGQHVMPVEAGTVEVVSGTAMAYADSWKVTIHGKQAHGSRPEQSIDPILIGSHIVTRLQSIVAREVSPWRSVVVTVGTFQAGLKENIIPASAEITLNIRTMDDDIRENVLASVRRIITAEAQASGAAEPHIEELSRFPRTYNDPEETGHVANVLRETLGSDRVKQGGPRMGSEDFGTLPEALGVPSVFWFFGGFEPEVIEAGIAPIPHSPRFVPVPEPTLWTGALGAVSVLKARLGEGVTT